GKNLVISATSDPSLNAQIAHWSRKRKIWVNAVDDPPSCDFFTAAVLERGPVRLAISTEGGLPGLSAFIKKFLTLLLPSAHDLDWKKLAELRTELKSILPNSDERMRVMRAVIAELEEKYFQFAKLKKK